MLGNHTIGFNSRCLTCLLVVLAGWVGAQQAADPRPAEDSPAARGRAASQRDLIRVQARAAEEPWLRINAGGHTATVQALAFTPDSRRLCSAGLDKNVLVWNLTALQRDLRRTFLRERTIRWQVARGLRGSIYALAVAPNDGLLALGGYGAMGSLGEILLIDPVSGELVQVLDSHRQTVCGLAFSADGQHLVSSDVAGQVTLWARETWTATVLCRPDDATYGPAAAKRIASQPKLRPIAVAGNRYVIVPAYDGPTQAGALRWSLRLHALDDPRQVRTLAPPHAGLVTSLAATPDGTQLASADMQGNVFVWALGAGPEDAPKVLRAEPLALSLCFTPDGRMLAAGTAVAAGTQQSQLQVWDLQTGQVVRSHALSDHVNACAASPDGRFLVYSGGRDNEILLEPLPASRPAVALRSSARRVWKVAFAKQAPWNRLAWGTEPRMRGFNDYAELNAAFDLDRAELSNAEPDADEWLPAEWSAGTWSVRREAGGGLQLVEGPTRRGRIELDPALEGRARCFCWIPDAEGRPQAIAVGTDVQNSVYVYRLVNEGRCPVLRHFRGHHDFVTSLSVARDLRHLASASADGTVVVWSLDGLLDESRVVRRWGADLTVQDGRLQVTSLRQAGPLFRRGIRMGDTVTEITWPAEGELNAEKRPAAILQQLQELPWMTQVVFRTSRNGEPRPAFQLVPAWQPLATLFVSSDREWAVWTPEGYYDASVNGHKLFGWQVNRGLQKLPDFYRADQYVATLERPDVIQRLLPAGNLEDALRQAAVRPEVETHEVLPEHISATPRVEILSPRAGDLIRDDSAVVTARIEVPDPRSLVRTRLFANGVVARNARLIREQPTDGGTELVYEWTVPLPSDPQNLIQLVAGTDAPTAALQAVLVERPDPPAAARTPRLSILAVGINRYQDPRIQPLDYAVADAQAVLSTLREHPQGLYEVERSVLLANQQVTRPRWLEALRQIAEDLGSDPQPDDLILLFLAGHGIVDEDTDRYYFVGYDLELADYLEGNYASCISWEDFRILGDIPCRKLVLLDTCHSGAIQPLRTQDLKAAIRALQEEVFLSVTASAGNERSEEDQAWGHGAFTKSLLEALDGRADVSGDKLVTLSELVDYVREAVPALTEGRQNPTAAPAELLPLVSVPLAQEP